MQFESGHLYHIYNRGNNSNRIFFNRENYLFFLNKLKINILPHADILAWCLMPNHFHLMVHINKLEIEVTQGVLTQGVTQSHPLSKLMTQSHPLSKLMTQSHPLSLNKKRSLNDSISIILRSYTRAIQKQEHRTGSLFQNSTKANCLTQMDGISTNWFQSEYGAIINVSHPEKEYPQVCFDYIHGNPVKDGLVKLQEEWEFSSARDYAGLRNGKLINKERANEFGLEY